MAATTIQKTKFIQAFDNAVELFPCDDITIECLDELFNEAVKAVKGEPSVSASPTTQETIKSESVFSQMRKAKDRSLQQFLTHRGSFF